MAVSEDTKYPLITEWKTAGIEDQIISIQKLGDYFDKKTRLYVLPVFIVCTQRGIYKMPLEISLSAVKLDKLL